MLQPVALPRPEPKQAVADGCHRTGKRHRPPTAAAGSGRLALHEVGFATGDNVWASRARSQRPSGRESVQVGQGPDFGEVSGTGAAANPRRRYGQRIEWEGGAASAALRKQALRQARKLVGAASVRRTTSGCNCATRDRRRSTAGDVGQWVARHLSVACK